jgi:hypothetical protein
MSEHMRIQLLDPKWAEEKKKFLDKQKDSNFVQGDEIARNINSFAKAVMGSAPVSSVSTTYSAQLNCAYSHEIPCFIYSLLNIDNELFNSG